MSRITVVQDGVCLKSDKELVRSALFSRSKELDRVLERKINTLSPNEYKMLADERDRTFALMDRYSRN
ncbi:hypothetical protein [Jeotgalibaca porci]|uniref:hypothetical protein n=1 Tax=Jeotgalibaca porci TaxID=1868793 RepID=UPI0035A0173C